MDGVHAKCQQRPRLDAHTSRQTYACKHMKGVCANPPHGCINMLTMRHTSTRIDSCDILCIHTHTHTHLCAYFTDTNPLRSFKTTTLPNELRGRRFEVRSASAQTGSCPQVFGVPVCVWLDVYAEMGTARRCHHQCCGRRRCRDGCGYL